MSTPVLVTGATGKQGGGAVDALLAKKKFQVYGLTRNPEGTAAKKLVDKGAQTVKGDFADKASIVEAIKSCSAKYFFLVSDPTTAGGVDAEAKQGCDCIDAAKESGTVEFVVLCSVTTCDTCPESVGIFKSKLKMENHLKESGLGYAILRPGFFLENFNDKTNMNPLTKGKLSSLAPSDALFFTIATADIGKAAATCFEQPEKWKGTTSDIISFIGTADELAAALSKASGAECKYERAFFAHLVKWIGWFGMLAEVKHMVYWFETVSKDDMKYDEQTMKALVPDPIQPEEFFRGIGEWEGGEKFASS